MCCPQCGSRSTSYHVEYGEWLSTDPDTGYEDYEEFEVVQCRECGSRFDPNELAAYQPYIHPVLVEAECPF